MDRMLTYFAEKRKTYPNLDVVLKKILSQRQTPADGITIAELQAAYEEETCTRFPVSRCITELLLTIPNIAVYSDRCGTRYFYSIE